MEVEEERTIWEGVSWTAAALFTEGKRAAAHYRLTNKALYFSEGLVSTTSQQVPLWAVRDIDVHQGLLQKSRGIGNVDVHVEHSDYTGREKVELKEIQDPEAVRDKLNEHAHRERLNYDQRQRTRYHSRGS